jgi:hypothetical protein
MPTVRRVHDLEAAQRLFGPQMAQIAALYELGDPGDERSDTPAWLDVERCNQGGAALRRHGLLSAAVLRCYALPLSYRSPVGVLPLLHTGALVDEAAGRLYRTASLVIGAQQHNAFAPGGPGWATAAHVRAMHERVRQSLRASGWDAANGAPIPQPDLAATALLFGPLTVEGLRSLGAFVSDDDADAVAHMARAIAHGQGVVDALQVDTHAEALALFAKITHFDGPASADGARLMSALLDVPHSLSRRWIDHAAAPFLRRLYADLAVATLGSDDAAALGVHSSGRWASPVRWLNRLGLHHHPRLIPLHDKMVAAVVARGRRRLAA